MDNVAKLGNQERADLFEQTASQRGFHPAIAEKDFWVCWVLSKLFQSDKLAPNLVFKGGTSLSKVYGLIERFSEDIDLVLNWELLGYSNSMDNPWQELPSNTQLDKFNRDFNIRAVEYIGAELYPTVQDLLKECDGITVDISEADGQVVNIQYPSAFALDALRPEVKLEIGPLASWVPSISRDITPYAAEEFPDVFVNPSSTVEVINATRTFWEKATILHQQTHRTSGLPGGYSRHYYDLYKLAGSHIKAEAFEDSELLLDVVRFKRRFYRSSWASYETAWPPAFKLIPSNDLLAKLEGDYRAMRPMFFSEPPKWDLLVSSLSDLELEINQLSW